LKSKPSQSKEENNQRADLHQESRSNGGRQNLSFLKALLEGLPLSLYDRTPRWHHNSCTGRSFFHGSLQAKTLHPSCIWGIFSRNWRMTRFLPDSRLNTSFEEIRLHLCIMYYSFRWKREKISRKSCSADILGHWDKNHQPRIPFIM
jgi:hypothetical protein